MPFISRNPNSLQGIHSTLIIGESFGPKRLNMFAASSGISCHM